MNKIILAAAAILVATAAPSFAQTYDHRDNTDGRQYNQYRRIDQGVRSGELTRGEAHRLYRQQQRIDHYQTYAVSDGRLSRGERYRLDQMQDRASNRIQNYKHNLRDRW